MAQFCLEKYLVEIKTEKTEKFGFRAKKPTPRIVEKDRKNRDRIIRSGNSSNDSQIFVLSGQIKFDNHG